MKKLLLIAFAFSTLAACQHTIFLPGSLRQRPDVAKERWGGNVAFGVRKAAGLALFDDLGSTPPTRALSAEAGLETLTPFPFVDVELGIFQNTEVYFNTGFGVKWLFVGTPGEEGWRAAVFGGAANDPWQSSSKDADCDTNCESAETDFNGAEYGITFGKQVSPTVLFYATVGQQKGKGKTVIKQTGGAVHTYNDDFVHSVGTLGITAGTDWYFVGELGAHNTKWDKEEGGSYDISGYIYTLGAGYRW